MRSSVWDPLLKCPLNNVCLILHSTEVFKFGHKCNLFVEQLVVGLVNRFVCIYKNVTELFLSDPQRTQAL